ncbi:hypothetical protein, partial [Neorhizobium galegae]|uniref:hypothetical protein n=1 Tax=Neorhizobium galegae TaxID=399 RepID=UPI0006277DFF
LLINSGTSRVYVADGALCRVPTIKPGVKLITDDGSLLRYPSGQEVAAIYAISYGSKGNAVGRFVEPGATALSEAPRGTTFIEDGKPFDTGAAKLKGYCSLSYLGMDGKDEGAFVDLSALDAAALSDAMAKLPRSELFNTRIDYDQPPYPTPELTSLK